MTRNAIRIKHSLIVRLVVGCLAIPADRCFCYFKLTARHGLTIAQLHIMLVTDMVREILIKYDDVGAYLWNILTRPD